jgi:Flp pilus assembly protein TadG
MKEPSSADSSATGKRGRDVVRAGLYGRLLGAVRSERGQALIEFAFILPILLVFLLSLVDFGIALDRREVIQHAVREGVRQAEVGLSEAQVTNIVVVQSQGILEAGDVTVCYVDGPGGAPAGFAGSSVRVSADYTYQFSIGGELLDSLGVDPGALSINMTPSAEGPMETSVLGAVGC